MSKFDELIRPFMTWRTTAIENSKNLFKELEELVPSIETKFSYSSLDESIVEEKTVDGNVTNSKYVLKRAINGKKFSFEHTLTEEDDINTVRENAWKQLDAWSAKIENVLENKEDILENKN